jgi:hypothetical protein
MTNLKFVDFVVVEGPKRSLVLLLKVLSGPLKSRKFATFVVFKIFVVACSSCRTSASPCGKRKSIQSVERNSSTTLFNLTPIG